MNNDLVKPPEKGSAHAQSRASPVDLFPANQIATLFDRKSSIKRATFLKQGIAVATEGPRIMSHSHCVVDRLAGQFLRAGV
jgi:hypothetical protein